MRHKWDRQSGRSHCTREGCTASRNRGYIPPRYTNAEGYSDTVAPACTGKPTPRKKYDRIKLPKEPPKNWMTLNQHGKRCLSAYVHAISAGDISESQLDYLNKKGLTDNKNKFNDWQKRNPISLECLTDIGIATANHYFPGSI